MSADTTTKRPSTSTTTTAARPPSKRVSAIPAPPKPPAQIDPTAIIANHAQLIGLHTITVGARSVIHPHAKLMSVEAGVAIGHGCVVWEKSVVGAEPRVQGSADEAGPGKDAYGDTVLGNNVVVESCAVVEEGARVGDNCVVESYARVCAGVTLGRGCKVQSFAVVKSGEIAEFTVMLSDGRRRRVDRSVEVVRRGREAAHENMVKDFGRVVPANNVKWT
jgi:dynactin-6